MAHHFTLYPSFSISDRLSDFSLKYVKKQGDVGYYLNETQLDDDTLNTILTSTNFCCILSCHMSNERKPNGMPRHYKTDDSLKPFYLDSGSSPITLRRILDYSIRHDYIFKEYYQTHNYSGEYAFHFMSRTDGLRNLLMDFKESAQHINEVPIYSHA
ncbi:MAG: hypothetical protein Salg2KO_10230 [Salibacteraceae bacterium]